MISFYTRALRRCVCGKPATVEILASGNVPYGHYCGRCATRRIKELDRAHNAVERAQRKRDGVA